MAFTCVPNLLTHGPLATSEAGGVVRTHTSSYLITGTAADFGTAATAPLVPLQEVISGLPLPGDGMAVIAQNTTSALYVISRTSRMEDATHAIVDVAWQQFETKLNTPDGIGTTHSVGTKTVTTSTDQSGQPLEVTYSDNQGVGSTQQASITVMDPEPVFSTELVIDIPGTTEPTQLTEYYVGKVNSTGWRGLLENSWLCTAATPRPLNPYSLPFGFRRYVYSFRFVASAYGQGWNPSIEWIDSTTRMPPANLVEGIGRKLVPWYEGADFSQEPQSIASGLPPLG